MTRLRFQPWEPQVAKRTPVKETQLASTRPLPAPNQTTGSKLSRPFMMWSPQSCIHFNLSSV